MQAGELGGSTAKPRVESQTSPKLSWGDSHPEGVVADGQLARREDSTLLETPTMPDRELGTRVHLLVA